MAHYYKSILLIKVQIKVDLKALISAFVSNQKLMKQVINSGLLALSYKFNQQLSEQEINAVNKVLVLTLTKATTFRI